MCDRSISEPQMFWSQPSGYWLCSEVQVVHVLVSRLEITAVECTCGDCVVLS